MNPASKILVLELLVKWVVSVALLGWVCPIERCPIVWVQRESTSQSLDQIRICDEVSTKHNQISAITLYLRGGIVAVEASCGEEVDATRLQNVSERSQRVLLDRCRI